MYIIIINIFTNLSFHDFLLISLNKPISKYITVAIMNIKLFILIIYAIIVRIDANIGYRIFLVSVYLIIKYTANRHRAILGMSPYTNVESIGRDTNVKINVNNNTLLLLCSLANCLFILYNAKTVKQIHITFNTLKDSIKSKFIILKNILNTNASEIC